MSKSTKKSRPLGCFVSVAGGLEKGVERGEGLGVNTLLLHPTPPQRWAAKEIPPEKARKLKEGFTGSKVVDEIYMHGVYLKNLANPDKQKLHLSKASLVNYLDLNERVGGSGVMFHPGSLKDREEGEALQQVSEVLDWILDHAEGESILMLEVSAGSGKVIGGRFEQLAQIFAGVSAKNQKRLKYCLDTQHMWASGYDIVSDLDVVIEELDNYLGLENVRCVHVNDSVPELGSGKDRHANLGEGTIGEKGIKGFINHKKLKHLPMLMETPALKDFPEGAQKEVDKLLAWAE